MPIAFACPECQEPLPKSLICLNCGYVGHFDGNVYYLSPDTGSRENSIEINGWIEVSKIRGTYLDNPAHYSLPDGLPGIAETYAPLKKHLDTLSTIESDGLSILDIGAGVAWADFYLLKNHWPNARITCIEISPDKFMGTSRIVTLSEHHKLSVTIVCGDMGRMPFAENQFDIAFTLGALHHSRNIPSVIEGIRRVLVPGGRYYGLNEPYRHHAHADENEYLEKINMLETQHGIIERRPTIAEYLEVGKCLDLLIMNDQLGLEMSSLLMKGTK